MEDDEESQHHKCENCKTALRNNVAEGTLVCFNCGLVHMHGLIDQTKENRVFAPNESGHVQNMDRTGNPIRIDKVDSIRTEFTGSSSKKRNKFDY